MKSNFIIKKTTQINDSLLERCDNLHQVCCDADSIKHSCCFEDEFDVYTDYPRLYYIEYKNELVGFLSTYIIDDASVEFSIFVHPRFRNNKMGTSLLKQFLKDYDFGNIEVAVHPNNEGGIFFLKENFFYADSTELLMQAHLNTFIPKTSKSTYQLVDFASNNFKYIIEQQCVGTCNTSYLSPSHVCISDVEIDENYRNQGMGYKFLHRILRDLALRFEEVILHVTKENVPAYKLYKKLGFDVAETTIFYHLKQSK